MVAGPDGNALVVEHGAHVVRMHALDHERQHAGLLPRRADDAHAVELAHPLGGVGEQLLLPGADGGAPDPLDVLERRAQPDDLRDRRRAGLEARRRLRPGARSSVTVSIMSPPPCQGGIASSSDVAP